MEITGQRERRIQAQEDAAANLWGTLIRQGQAKRAQKSPLAISVPWKFHE